MENSISRGTWLGLIQYLSELGYQHIYHHKERNHVLSKCFLFPLAGLKDDALGIGWDLLETERSLVEGAGIDGNCIGAAPDFPGCGAGTSLCKQIDNTTSTSGVGPENFKKTKFPFNSSTKDQGSWNKGKPSLPMANTIRFNMIR